MIVAKSGETKRTNKATRFKEIHKRARSFGFCILSQISQKINCVQNAINP